VIISASRRTDIPAFYGEWFMNRLDAGYCEVANPFNPKQVSRVSLAAEYVDAIVFWTRYPATLADHMSEIRRRGYPVGVLYTIVDYPEALEPAAPPLERRIEAFKRLVDLCGVGAVVWRYDPIIVSNMTPAAYHRERFAAIADALSGYVDRVIVSLLQPYKSVMRSLARIPGLSLADHGDASTAPGPEVEGVVREIATAAAARGIAVQSCADPRLEGVSGIQPEACISDELLQAAGARPTPSGGRPRAANQRRHCRCLESRDIGAYETCLFGCRYCYATHGSAKAQENARRHDPTHPRLLPQGSTEDQNGRHY
jgi:hypothetical protein